jgi:hypothetical protein
MKLVVECYSGARADERPHALVLGARRLPVTEVLDTWYGEDHLYFKVLVEGGDEYIVRRDVAGEWAVHSFVAAKPGD